MRTQEEIKREYSELVANKFIRLPNGNIIRVNEDKRTELKKEYEQTLPIDQQLAIYLHNKMCKLNHIDYCSFKYGIHGLEHDWNEYAHAEYLLKAQRLLTISDDLDFLKRIITAIG